MEKPIICQKKGHNMPLDMVCINMACPQKGLLCHKCFMDFPHNHMGSEIKEYFKFVQACQHAFDQSKIQISTSKGELATKVKEEYNKNKMLLEDCKTKAEETLNQLFTEIENKFTAKFEAITEEIEGPKNNVLNEIDKYRTYIKEMQSGLVDETDEIETELKGIWKIFRKNDQNEFELKKELIKSWEENKVGEMKKSFKQHLNKSKECVNLIHSWIKERPRLEPLAKETQEKKSPKTKEVKKFKNMNQKENIPEYSNVTGEKRQLDREDEDKIKGSNPIKKIKNSNDLSNLGNSINTNLQSDNPPLRSKKHEEPKNPYEFFKKGILATRFSLDTKEHENFKYLDTHTITFRTKKNILLLGFQQYAAIKATIMAVFEYNLFEGEAADQTDDMPMPPKVLSSGTFNLTKENKSQTLIPIPFDKPVKILKNMLYTLKVVNKTKNIDFYCYRGINGVEKVPPFRFYESRMSDKALYSTGTKEGQIPEFVYLDSA